MPVCGASRVAELVVVTEEEALRVVFDGEICRVESVDERTADASAGRAEEAVEVVEEDTEVERDEVE